MRKRFIALENRAAAALTRDDRGATAVEYGLIVALIAAVIITAVTTIGNSLVAVVDKVASAL